MTDDGMALLELVEKDADVELVREMPAFAAGRLLELEVEATTGAAKGVRSAQRNGCRERGWRAELIRRSGSCGRARACRASSSRAGLRRRRRRR